jgi:polysaccharide biosynthesis protein PslJ
VAPAAVIRRPVHRPAAPARMVTRPARRRSRLGGWPVVALFAGFPIWWLLGLGGFIWPILAIPMVVTLCRRRRLRAPAGFGWWLAFLVWMLASAIMLDSADRWIAFTYRALLYASMTVVLLYVFNLSDEELPQRRLVAAIAGLWVVTVVGGIAGLVAPNWSMTSPVERVLPKHLVANDFVHQLVHPATSDIQAVLGYDLPRPKAPFAYPNDWGAVFGLGLPFAFLAARSSRRPSVTPVIVVVGLASLAPVVLSLDRGLWLSLGAAVAYVAVRLALTGRTRLLRRILAIVPIALALLWLSPLRGVVESRFAHPHSNQRRLDLYQEATSDVLASPLFGYGAPRPNPLNPDAPSVGTQGQFWLVLYSHGFVGVAFFLGWFIAEFRRTKRMATGLEMAAHISILIALVQFPYYEMLPTQLAILMCAIGMAGREQAAMASPAAGPPARLVAAP